MIYDSRKRS